MHLGCPITFAIAAKVVSTGWNPPYVNDEAASFEVRHGTPSFSSKVPARVVSKGWKPNGNGSSFRIALRIGLMVVGAGFPPGQLVGRVRALRVVHIAEHRLSDLRGALVPECLMKMMNLLSLVFHLCLPFPPLSLPLGLNFIPMELK